jgi:apolipoprotein N-acyltransferase
MTHLICVLLSGTCFFFSIGIYGAWPLAWVAPLPLLWLAYGQGSSWQLATASFASFALGQMNLFVAYHDLFPILGLVVIVLPSCLGFTAAILFARAAQRRLPALLAVFAFPAVWTSVEYIWSLVSPHGSFGASAYSQVPAPLLIQTSSLFGWCSVSFLIGLVASALALALHERKQARVLTGIALSVFAINLVFGVIRFGLASGEVARIGLAAQDIPAGSRLPSGRDRVVAITEAYGKVAQDLAARGASVVVLPELTSVLAPPWRDMALTPLANAARESNATIVAGFLEVSNDREYNVALTFAPNQSLSRYIKRHTLFPLDQSVRGDRPGLLGNGRAVAICKDMDFPATIRADASNDLRVMFVPAADFGADGWMHARMSVLRGVENGFAIARAARNGMLTLSDDRGRIVGSVASGDANIASLIGDVQLGSGGTLYRRIGDVFAWACIALAAALVAGIGFALNRDKGSNRS